MSPTSYEVLDITGSRLSVVDGRGLTPLIYRYNMLQAPCYQLSIDSGTGRTLLDVAGQPLFTWDALDNQTEMEYDVLRRPLKRITDGKTLEQYFYGETLTNPKDNNYRGQVYRTYDGSGRQQVDGYDFKGNPIATQLQLLENPELTDADWSVLDDTDLSTEVFTNSGTYDALNRPITSTDPGGNIQSYTYDKSGALKTVELNAQVYVQDIHYDAKGQRQAIWYGNGTKTSNTYDEFTFRLRRLLTVNLHNNEILQDLNYWYDPVGNITELQDHAQQTLFFNNSVVSPTQAFIYDALYRLIQAQGRELIGTATFGSEDNWNDAAWQTTQKGDGNAVQNYTQLYTYDAVGNILELQHIATAGSYTRTYEIASDSNQLLNTTVGAATYTYQYDARGNMTEMPHLDGMHWNLNNELYQIENGTMQAYFQYSGGQRIRKFVTKGNITEERIYLGSFEIYRKFENSSLIIERHTVHVSDDTGRIAMLEKRTVGNASDDHNTTEELTRFVYSNHLQSASLELDESGAIISYEEYHPYGTTSYQAMNTSIQAVAKRYRYTGKERDEESGLYYHGARYYIPWLARWTASDPLESKYAGMSPYNYSFNNPVVWNDLSGMQPGDGDNKWHPPMVVPEKTGFADGVGSDENPIVLEEAEIILRPPLTETAKERINNDAYSSVLSEYIPSISLDMVTNTRLIVTGDMSMFDELGQKINKIINFDQAEFDKQVDLEIKRLTEFALKGEAGSFSEMVQLTRYQRNDVKFVGDVIQMIKNDPDFQRFEQEALSAFEMGKEIYDQGVTFGGDRGTLPDFFFNPWDERREETTQAIANPLTWMLRHANVQAFASYSEEGNLSVKYLITDKLDLDPHEVEPYYNMIAVPLGKIWGDLMKYSFPETWAFFTIQY